MADDSNPLVHYEHGIPVIDAKLSDIQREQKDAKDREKEQRALNRKMVRFTGLLVLVGAVGSGVSIWQARIAKRSADAATSAAHTANDTLKEMQTSGTDTHDLAVQAEKQSANTEKLARAATSEASAARVQAENTRESLRKSDEAFRLSQQPYITVGRKDGVVAELMESNDATQPVGIILYFQNSGHLPAITTCVSTRTFGTPLMNPFDYGNILIRQAGKDSTGRRRVAESSCPTVGGDTAYSFPIRPFSEQTLTQLKSNKQSDFRVHETIQYCDAFGHYFCKSAMLKYEREPISGFSEEGESDCSGYYRANPDTPNTMYGTNEQLPACPQPGEILKNQEDDMRVWGWKLLSHP